MCTKLDIYGIINSIFYLIFETDSSIVVELRKPLYMYKNHSLSRVVVPATLHNISVNAHFTRFL